MEEGYTIFKRHHVPLNAEHYISLAQMMLNDGLQSPSLLQLSLLSADTNLVDVEKCYNKALEELNFEPMESVNSPSIEILQISKQILQEENEEELIRLIQEISFILADLNYPAALKEWTQIVNLQHALEEENRYTQHEIFQMLREEAKKMIG